MNNNVWNATVIHLATPTTDAIVNPNPGSHNESERLSASPWDWWREQMPITDRWSYLDHAAVGPLSGPAAQAIRQFADQAEKLGDTVWPQWNANLDRLRKNVAELLGASHREICLVPNTTTGINLVAEGYPWEPGDNVVIPDGEFPSNLFPWLHQRSRGVEVRIVPRVNGAVRTSDLMSQVDDSTRIVAVSWVGYASGYRIDLDELVDQVHRRGALVFLDAIQGVGMYPLDLANTGVDFLASDGHKWLLGPEGAGITFVRAEQMERLRCTNVGWASVANPFNYADPSFVFRSDAQRFESGSANMIGAAALNASVELFLQVRRTHGHDAIARRVVDLASSLSESLQAIGARTRLPQQREHRSGILTFDLPGVEPSTIRKRAAEREVVVSCRDGGVRASLHAYNHQDDLDRLIDVVKDCSSS